MDTRKTRDCRGNGGPGSVLVSAFNLSTEVEPPYLRLLPSWKTKSRERDAHLHGPPFVVHRRFDLEDPLPSRVDGGSVSERLSVPRGPGRVRGEGEGTLSVPACVDRHAKQIGVPYGEVLLQASRYGAVGLSVVETCPDVECFVVVDDSNDRPVRGRHPCNRLGRPQHAIGGVSAKPGLFVQNTVQGDRLDCSRSSEAGALLGFRRNGRHRSRRGGLLRQKGYRGRERQRDEREGSPRLGSGVSWRRLE